MCNILYIFTRGKQCPEHFPLPFCQAVLFAEGCEFIRRGQTGLLILRFCCPTCLLILRFRCPTCLWHQCGCRRFHASKLHPYQNVLVRKRQYADQEKENDRDNHHFISHRSESTCQCHDHQCAYIIHSPAQSGPKLRFRTMIGDIHKSNCEIYREKACRQIKYKQPQQERSAKPNHNHADCGQKRYTIHNHMHPSSTAYIIQKASRNST